MTLSAYFEGNVLSVTFVVPRKLVLASCGTGVEDTPILFVPGMLCVAEPFVVRLSPACRIVVMPSSTSVL